jgi:hypothetical protein
MLYQISKWIGNIPIEQIGFVDTEEEAKRICDNYNKYNTLSTYNPEYYVYKLCTESSLDLFPYIQATISVSDINKKVMIELFINHTPNYGQVKLPIFEEPIHKSKMPNDEYSVIDVFFVIPQKENIILEEKLKEICIEESIRYIKIKKIERVYKCKSYDVYLGEEKIDKTKYMKLNLPKGIIIKHSFTIIEGKDD